MVIECASGVGTTAKKCTTSCWVRMKIFTILFLLGQIFFHCLADPEFLLFCQRPKLFTVQDNLFMNNTIPRLFRFEIK